ncbi:MAG: hypothetical protein GY795_41810 [Desulfobacterales bacterium]|nr:hypothetical protein [Desulfobacterales bacterium]
MGHLPEKFKNVTEMHKNDVNLIENEENNFLNKKLNSNSDSTPKTAARNVLAELFGKKIFKSIFGPSKICFKKLFLIFF